MPEGEARRARRRASSPERRERQSRGRRSGGGPRGGGAVPGAPVALGGGGPASADGPATGRSWSGGCDRAAARLRDARRRSLRAGLGRVARSCAAAGRTCHPEELGLKGVDRTTVDLVLEERREAAAGSRTTTGWSSPPTESPRNASLARNARSLARVADPRQRRQRAYALLARNGFDPDVCRSVQRPIEDVGAGIGGSRF